MARRLPRRLAAYRPGADRRVADTRLYKDSRFLIRDRFSVEVVGRGKDLVLVPGLSSSRDTWRVTADRLKDRYRLHLIQLAGFAGEPARANATGEFMGPVAEAIDAYLVEAKLTPATYIGHRSAAPLACIWGRSIPTTSRRSWWSIPCHSWRR